MRKIYLLFALLNSMQQINAQEKTQVIEYDFKLGNYTENKCKIYQKTPTVLKIKNINALFYRISIQPKDVAMNDYRLFDKDTLRKMTKIVLPDVSNYEPMRFDNLTSFSNLFPSESKPTKPKNNDDGIQNLMNKINGEKITLEKFLTKDNISDKTVNPLIDDNDSINDLKKSILENENKLKNKIDETENINELYEILKNNLKRLNNDFDNIYTNSINIKSISTRYNNFIDKINRPELTFEDFEKINSCKETDYEQTPILNKDKINEYYNHINNIEKIYSQFVNEHNNYNTKEALDKLQKIDSKNLIIPFFKLEYERLRNNASEIHYKVSQIQLSKKLNQVEIIRRLLSNKDSYEYASAPIQGTEDYLEFDVNISSKNSFSDPLAINYSKSFKYFDYLNGGVRYDFSVGTVFDFGVKNKEFGIQKYKDGTVDKYKIIENSNNKFNPTIAGILHASFRNSSIYAFGFSLGASVSTTELSINSLFPGVSLLIGRRDKIIFTAGPSFIKTKELKSQYNEVDVEESFDISNATTENFKIGYFFGITYNLTNKQKGALKVN